MLTLFLWLKYLRKRKIVLLSIAAVALSAALLVIVCSLFTGFIDAVENSAVSVIGDIDISPPVKVANYQQFIKQLEKSPQIEAATGVLTANGLLHLSKGDVRAVSIWGVEPAGRARVTDFEDALLVHKNQTNSLSFNIPESKGEIAGFVGIAVVAEPNERTDQYDMAKVQEFIGQRVVLTTGVADDTDADNKTKLKRKVFAFTVSDIVFTGVYHLDKSHIYLPIDRLQQKLFPNLTDPVADKIQIKLSADSDTSAAIKEIEGLWRAFAAEELGWNEYLIDLTKISTASQMQKKYVAELRKQLGVLLLIFGIVSLGVVLLISCIFYMIVQTRQKDIAIIKSCGAKNSTVALTFLGYGGCVGLAGAVVGFALGSLITKNINSIEHWLSVVFGLKLWKSSVYMFDKIPDKVNLTAAFWISIAAIAAAALGALIPARVATKTRPMEILRYE